MRLPHLYKPPAAVIALLIFSAWIYILWQPQTSIIAQSPCSNTNCQPPPPNQQSWSHWEKGKKVSVIIDSTFTVQEQNAIKAAFNNWQNANGATGNESGVTFQFTVAPISGTPSPGQCQVRNQAPLSNPNWQGEALARPTADNMSISHAAIFINPGITDLTALTQATAHEIGHTMGLGGVH